MQVLNSYVVKWSGVTASAVNTDLGASATSDPILVSSYPNFSFNPTWATANTPVGTLDVQVCNAKRSGNTILPANTTASWVTVASVQLAVGTDPSPGIQLFENVSFGWARLVYTRASGGSGDLLSCEFQGTVA